MKEFYTVFFIRKRDGAVLRRFCSQEHNKYFWEQTKLKQMKYVLDKYIDLDRSEIEMKEFVGNVKDVGYDEEGVG